MALEDAFASHAQAKPGAISAPIGKSSDPAVRESGQEPKTKVFISYSRKDIAFADGLDAALRARGFKPLIDRTDIYAFEEWWKRVRSARECRRSSARSANRRPFLHSLGPTRKRRHVRFAAAFG